MAVLLGVSSLVGLSTSASAADTAAGPQVVYPFDGYAQITYTKLAPEAKVPTSMWVSPPGATWISWVCGRDRFESDVFPTCLEGTPMGMNKYSSAKAGFPLYLGVSFSPQLTTSGSDRIWDDALFKRTKVSSTAYDVDYCPVDAATGTRSACQYRLHITFSTDVRNQDPVTPPPTPPTPVNAAPVFSSMPASPYTFSKAKPTFTVSGSDPDGDDVTLTWSTLPLAPLKVECTPSAPGKVVTTTCSVSKTADSSVVNELRFGITDSKGLSSTRTLRVVPKTYLVMGDSYASGEGSPPFLPGTAARGIPGIAKDGSCHRSNAAWPALLGGSTSYAFLGSVACSAANSNALTQPFKGERPQIEAAYAINPQPDLIVLMVGGNDVGFGTMAGVCAMKMDMRVSARLCSAAVGDTVNKINKELPNKLGADLTNIHAKFPNAEVLLVGYPSIMNTGAASTVRCPWLSLSNKERLAVMSSTLDKTMAASVKGRPYASYASTLNAVRDHELCAGDSWIIPIGLLNTSVTEPVYYAHPTVTGHQKIAAEVSTYINANLG